MQASHSDFQLLEVPNVGHAPALMVPAQLEAIAQRISA
jgi:hypothetical protein